MKLDMSDLFKKMDTHESKLKKAVVLYAKTSGLKLEGIAKEDAPWTDQTGNARNSLKGGADEIPNGAEIFLSGNMEYSKYLEHGFGRDYAVIEDTVTQNADAILKGLGKILNK